jgi:hypothetical protein
MLRVAPEGGPYRTFGDEDIRIQHYSDGVGPAFMRGPYYEERSDEAAAVLCVRRRGTGARCGEEPALTLRARGWQTEVRPHPVSPKPTTTPRFNATLIAASHSFEL